MLCHFVIVVNHCVLLIFSGVLGDQSLAVHVMSVRGRKLPTFVDRLPLSPKSTLACLG